MYRSLIYIFKPNDVLEQFNENTHGTLPGMPGNLSLSDHFEILVDSIQGIAQRYHHRFSYPNTWQNHVRICMDASVLISMKEFVLQQTVKLLSYSDNTYCHLAGTWF